MKYLILLLIIVVIAGIYWKLRMQGNLQRLHKRHVVLPGTDAGTSTREGELEKLKSNEYFWGVEIIHAGCEASRALSGRQFPFGEAPILPLGDCDKSLCNCIYKGLKDDRVEGRRTQADRRDDLRFDTDKPDRRSPKDRRRGEAWKNRGY